MTTINIKQRRNENAKRYYKEHKEEILKRLKEQRLKELEDNMEVIYKYYPECQKRYYENNKTFLCTKNKEYYYNNKESILQKKKEKLRLLKEKNELFNNCFFELSNINVN